MARPRPGKIIRNAAKCHGCGVTVESRHRHDFQECKCGNIFVDGGLSYLRRGGMNTASVEDLSVVEEQGPSIEDEMNDDWTTSDLFEEAS